MAPPRRGRPRRRRVTPADIRAAIGACRVMSDFDRASCFFKLGERAERAAGASRSPAKLRVLGADLKVRAEALWAGGAGEARRKKG